MKTPSLPRVAFAVLPLCLALHARAQLTLIEIGGPPLAGNLSTAGGSAAFGKDEIGGGGISVHKIPNIRDGIYGNGNSWIGDSPNSFIGINLGAAPLRIGSVAWGRDNTATFGDRSGGTYTLEYTTEPNPTASTVAWTPVGSVTYIFNGNPGSPLSMSLRHAWSFPAVDATGIRLTVPGSSFGDGGCVDELEVSGVRTAPLRLTEVGGTMLRPANLALGKAAFGKDEILGGSLLIHKIPNINDGIYGNNNSWIGDTAASFVGVNLGAPTRIGRVAFGRDNTATFSDRCQGNYLLQYTTVASPSAATPDASWVTIGPVFYDPATPTPSYRHEYAFTPVTATGVRLIVPGLDLGSFVCIDELELYGDELALTATGGTMDPCNLALGKTAFGRDELRYEPPATPGTFIHVIEDINDGIYGNNNSWIGASLNSFVGVAFGGTHSINRFAFGRDNTGTYADRSAGRYLLQYTTDPTPSAATPDAAWVNIGLVYHEGASPANALRHEYSFPPVTATGIRFFAPGDGVPSGACIDELEVYVSGTTTPTVACPADVAVTVAAGQSGGTATYPAPTVTGTCPTASVSCNPPSGSTFAAGTNAVVCAVTTPSGYSNGCSFSVVVNRAPSAGDNTLGALENESRSVLAAKLLGNDADEDGDALTVTAVSGMSALGGTVTLDIGSVTYLSPTNVSGADSFTYTVSDGRGGTATATVQVTVLDASDPTLNRIGGLTLLPGGGVRVRFAGIPGRTYRFQRTTDLMNPMWTTLATEPAPDHGIMEFTDPSPPPGQAFYRTVAP